MADTLICNVLIGRSPDETYPRCEYEFYGACCSGKDTCEIISRNITECTVRMSPENAALAKMAAILRYQNNTILQNQKSIMERLANLEKQK